MNKDKLEVFMNYLKEQFPGCIEDHFTYDLIKNLIDYVYIGNTVIQRTPQGRLLQTYFQK